MYTIKSCYNDLYNNTETMSINMEYLNFRDIFGLIVHFYLLMSKEV